MVLGLITYVAGSPWVIELDQNQPAMPSTTTTVDAKISAGFGSPL